jgi:hypothetical protein
MDIRSAPAEKHFPSGRERARRDGGEGGGGSRASQEIHFSGTPARTNAAECPLLHEPRRLHVAAVRLPSSGEKDGSCLPLEITAKSRYFRRIRAPLVDHSLFSSSSICVLSLSFSGSILFLSHRSPMSLSPPFLSVPLHFPSFLRFQR